MADASSQRSSWGWDMPTYDPRKSFEIGRSFQSSDDNEEDDDDVAALLDSAAASGAPHPNSISRRLSLPILGANQKHASPAIANELLRLYQQISVSRAEMLELRQEASDLQEYSNAKILRVTRYLGVLADKSHKLDQTVLETEAQLSSLRKEKRKLFNSLVGVKGNIRVYCRVRPQFEHEGPSVTEFPDDFLIRVNTASLTANPIGLTKKEFELDRVYGPHVGQGDFFQDVQPFVQSALDGYNVCVFAYGHSGSGKTYTMEGPSNDRGVFFRAFEELFDLSNNDMTSTSKFSFAMSIFELNNEICDLLLGSTRSMGTVQMGYSGKPVELTQERVENPIEFSRIYKSALQGRSKDASANPAHLVLTIHIRYTNSFSGESYYSKLSMVDMVASESLSREDATGDRLTELLHINKSFSALGDVLSALTAKKEYVPYGNSKLTQILADSLGGDAKTLLIVNLSPCQNDVQETVSSLQFAARARNVELSLGNRDTIKKWRDMANETRKELYEKEKEISEMHQQVMELKKHLKDADDQCLLLFNEVQKAWKVAFTLQSDHKSQTASLVEKEKVEREQNIQLRAQIQQLTKSDQDQKAQLQEYKDKVQQLERKVQELNQLAAEARPPQSTPSTPREGDMFGRANLRHVHRVDDVDMQQGHIESEATKRLEEELAKRDELIERLHEENEKLFGRLTERNAPAGSPRVQKVEAKGVDNFQLDPSSRTAGGKPPVSPEVRLTSAKMESSSGALTVAGNMALVKSGSEKIKTTPAGEYLTSALNDFNPDQSDGSAAADGANKLLMLVLAAVIKAGAAREHEMLAEIRSAVFSFIRKMEPLRVMDTMLVSRVRILYIRSLLSRSPELQSIKVPAVERFLEKVGSGSSTRRGSRGSSPARSPMRHESNLLKDLIDEHVQGFKVHIKQERKSKFSSIVLKLRGIDQETWRQHVTGGKLRETTEEARNYAIGNKALAALFVHTPAGELQRQIRSWLAENFDFLSLSGGDGVNGTAGQLELLSTAIMDGWMSGLGVPQRPSTDALGQLLSDYTKRMYTSQLQHLKDVAATLATEEAEDLGQIAKLRSALESVEHKRRKVLQQMRSDVALLTKEEGGSPIRNPSTASEDARIASLMSLEDIVKHAEEIKREAPVKAIFASRKQSMLSALQALSERMPSLLSIDHPCAQKHILDSKNVVESISEQHEGPHHTRGRAAGSDVPGEVSSMSGDWGDSAMFGPDGDVMQWSVLQFNNGSTNPFVIKCGANSSLELVVKAQAKVQDKTGKEIIAVVPAPSTLAGLSLEEIKQVLARLPEAFGQLALARTADGTRARYARLYKTLAIRVPALKSSIPDVDREHSRELSTTSLSIQRRVD